MKYGKLVRNSFILGILVPVMVSGGAVTTFAMSEGIKIGILAFDPDDAETKTYREYLENYLGEAFDAEFYYSEAVHTFEEEKAFIDRTHEMGVKGIIGNISEEAMELCEEYGMYYMYGSATVNDEVFERIKNNEYFIGTISSSLEEEKEAGYNMADFFTEDEQKAEHGFIICTGGDNEMHKKRAAAMLERILENYDISMENSIDELLSVDEVTELETDGNIKIALIPGYPGVTPLAENVEKVVLSGGYDTVMSVLSINSIMDSIRKAEEITQNNMRVGSVDCFTEEAALLYETEDIFGNSEVDYLTGTYGAMIAPSFVAMGNAYSGNIDMIREDGEAFRLYRSYWTAKNKDEFEELYEKSVSLYDNAYSAVDIMKVLKEYNPEVIFEDFKEFTER